jgi:hypothetical protein
MNRPSGTVVDRVRVLLYVPVAILVAYCVGFYAVMLGVRSNDDKIREVALSVETYFYYPLLASTSNETSLIRRLYLHRVAMMCKGYEHRCRVASVTPAS